MQHARLELPHDKLEGISFFPWSKLQTWLGKAAFTLCQQGKHLVESIRTKSHRYTEWIDYADRDDDHATVRFTELYHLDVDELEQVNLANRIEYAPKRRELAELLSEGWESALPPPINGCNYFKPALTLFIYFIRRNVQKLSVPFANSC